MTFDFVGSFDRFGVDLPLLPPEIWFVLQNLRLGEKSFQEIRASFENACQEGFKFSLLRQRPRVEALEQGVLLVDER